MQIVSKDILKQLESIKQRKNSLTFQLGQIEFQKSELEKSKKSILNTFTELKDEEQTLIDFIEKTYGNGTLDLNTGEFQSFTN